MELQNDSVLQTARKYAFADMKNTYDSDITEHKYKEYVQYEQCGQYYRILYTQSADRDAYCVGDTVRFFIDPENPAEKLSEPKDIVAHGLSAALTLSCAGVAVWYGFLKKPGYEDA